MKKLSAMIAFGLALTHASTAEVPATFVKLVGLSTVPDARYAFLLVLEGRLLGEVMLTEGKSAGAVELVSIDDQSMTVKIRNGGTESVLSFAPDAPSHPPARAIMIDRRKKSGAVRFQNLTLNLLLDYHAQINGRTILRPTILPVGVIAAQGQNLDREGIVRFLERTMTRAHIQTLPQGDKFTVVLPESYALPASALWKNRKNSFGKNRSQADVPAGTIAFINVDLAQVLQFYGDFSGRKVERAADLPNLPITFKVQTSLTGAEALYALDTVLILNGIQIVTVDDRTAKAVAVAPPVNKPALAAKTKPTPSK